MHQIIVEYLQWRIQVLPEGDANFQGDGCANLLFCRKLHENERIWTKFGLVPDTPLDPPLISLLVLLLNVSLLFNFIRSTWTKLEDLTKLGSGRKTLM